MELQFPITSDFLAVNSCWLKHIRKEFNSRLDLTIPQFRVLSALRQPVEHRTVKHIGELLELSSSTTSFICDKLEVKDLLLRKRIPDNRRAVDLHLTPTGRRLHKEGIEVNEEVSQKVFKPLGNYMKQLLATGVVTYQENYRLQSKNGEYLIDDTYLNTLFLYNHRLHMVLKNFGLTLTEFRVLFEVKDHPGGAMVSELAHILLLRASELTSACNKLESSGCINRKTGEQDRRVIIVDITPGGLDCMVLAAEATDEVFCYATAEQNIEERYLFNKAARIIAAFQRQQVIHS